MSEGDMMMNNKQEGRDGYDLVEWVAQQEWSNQRWVDLFNSFPTLETIISKAVCSGFRLRAILGCLNLSGLLQPRDPLISRVLHHMRVGVTCITTPRIAEASRTPGSRPFP